MRSEKGKLADMFGGLVVFMVLVFCFVFFNVWNNHYSPGGSWLNEEHPRCHMKKCDLLAEFGNDHFVAGLCHVNTTKWSRH